VAIGYDPRFGADWSRLAILGGASVLVYVIGLPVLIVVINVRNFFLIRRGDMKCMQARSVALSLCTAAHPFHTRFAHILGRPSAPFHPPAARRRPDSTALSVHTPRDHQRWGSSAAEAVAARPSNLKFTGLTQNLGQL
jgi:hypothetical protein